MSFRTNPETAMTLPAGSGAARMGPVWLRYDADTGDYTMTDVHPAGGAEASWVRDARGDYVLSPEPPAPGAVSFARHGGNVISFL